MSDELTSDLQALARATDRVPSLATTRSALDALDYKETLMSKIFRRPLVAIAILLFFLIASPVAYALATHRFHLFVDADQPTETIDTSVQQQAHDQGAHADVHATKDDDGIHLKLGWRTLKEMLGDCLDGSGAPRELEAEIAQGGHTTTSTLDPEKYRRLMAVLVEADQLHDQLQTQHVPGSQCEARMLDLIEQRVQALGVTVPPPASGSNPDRIRALEQAVHAWLTAGTAFQLHVGE